MEYTIKPPDDTAFGEVRTYFTEYDPVVQEWYHGRFIPSRLLDKLKLLTLVNDSITVAAAHMVRSETTFTQLRENRKLLEEGIIVPAINDDFDSFEDMVDRKLRLDRYTAPWLPNESISESTLFDRAKFLDKHSSLLMGWDLEDMRSTFKESLLRDISDEGSRVRTNLRGVDAETLRLRLQNVEPFSRRNILEQTDDLLRPDQAVLYDQMNANYHFTGSTVHRASVNAHSHELRALGDKFRRGIDAEFDDPQVRDEFLTRYDLSPAFLKREDAFKTHLDVIDLGREDLRYLDIDDVIELREQRITQRYRTKLLEILNRVNQSSDGLELSDLEDELREEIERRRDRERQRVKVTKYGLLSGVYASGIGVYLTGAQELGFALHLLDPLIRRFVNDIPYLVGNDFLAFEQRFTDSFDRE